MTVLAPTVARLRQLAAEAPDASGHFPAMYAHVTQEVGRRLERPDGFVDPERAHRLTTVFADFYLGTVDGSRPVPRCWAAADAVRADRSLLVVQHLLLGINAHVNHDLAQAVVAVAEETGDLAGLRPDFETVNDVLASAYRTVLRRLDRATRWVEQAAAVGGERLFRFSLTAARDQAWCAAERLARLDPGARRADVAELDRLVAVLALLVTRPPGPLAPLVRLARRCEEQDPRAVTALLLDG